MTTDKMFSESALINIIFTVHPPPLFLFLFQKTDSFCNILPKIRGRGTVKFNVSGSGTPMYSLTNTPALFFGLDF